MLACAFDPAGMKAAGLRAEADYRQHFTLEAMAASYVKLYQSFIRP
jgi:hypothetical protein